MPENIAKELTARHPSSDTQLTELPGLPRLNYNLRDHKKKLIIVSSLLVIECSILPIALFYPLWFRTTLRHGILFAIITAFFGLVTGVEFALRSWKLIQKSDRFRPLGGHRWRFDFTHFTLSFGYTYMTAILIGVSIPTEPLVRPLALPAPLFFLQAGFQLLLTGWMHATNRPAPFRISSVAKGERTPTLVYTLVEDIVAVDGSAGKEYREALMARYRASAKFRLLITQLNWFWGIGAFLDGVGTIVVIFTVDKIVAYGVGWGSPLVFSVIWTIITIHWARRSLLEEKLQWRAERKPIARSQQTSQSNGSSVEHPEMPDRGEAEAAHSARPESEANEDGAANFAANMS